MATLVITPEIEAAAIRIAKATGTTPQEAFAGAVQKQLNLVDTAENPRGIDWAAVDAVIQKLHESGPIDYSLTDDEILGYDEHGLPGHWADDRR